MIEGSGCTSLLFCQKGDIMKYIEMDIITRDEYRDRLLGLLYDFGQYTIEEYSKNIIEELDQEEKDWDFVDESILQMEDGKLIIKTYPQNQEDAKAIASAIEKEQLGICQQMEKDDEDWANNWKAYYKPLELGKKLAIVPSWEKYDNSQNRLVIQIDPGMAFGTGTHETTSLCMEALEKYIQRGDIVFDIGCGSGILGISALKLGAKKAVLVDIDDKCIEASHDNALRNEVASLVDIRKGNLLDTLEEEADLIVSNIIAEIIVDEIAGLKNRLKPGGIFITSGIITEKIQLVQDALLQSQFELLEQEERNGWNIIVARAK